MELKSKLEELKKKADLKVNQLKDSIQDSAEMINDLSKKDYVMSVSVDKSGIKHEVKSDRPTKHNIKWRSKGH